MTLCSRTTCPSANAYAPWNATTLSARKSTSASRTPSATRNRRFSSALRHAFLSLHSSKCT
eukprot:565485-Rhodomonas_salina.1